jgi:hypothetical protein
MICHGTELRINLLFISPRLNDEPQPLDRFVFSVMKANCRLLSRANAVELGAMNKQIATATAFLVRAWEAVSPEVLNDAWSIDEDFDHSEH